MAIARNKITMFLNLGLMISLVLIFRAAESRSVFTGSFFDKEASETLICESVVGVNSGDTCFAIAQAHNLTSQAFDAINPNLNCTDLFVGQWICIDASSI